MSNAEQIGKATTANVETLARRSSPSSINRVEGIRIACAAPAPERSP
jgi:hypothetical protein